MKKVAIIGAGLAGISAAVELAGKGLELSIFEQKESPGGRAYSIYDHVAEEWIDNGKHLMMTAYNRFLEVARILGSRHLLEVQMALSVNFRDVSGTQFILDSSKFPGQLGMVAGIMNFKGATVASRISCITLASKIKLGITNPGNMTTREFLEKNNQSEDIIRNFWEPIIVACMNTSVEKASARLFVEILNRAFFGGAKNSRLIFPKTTLSSLFSNFNSYMSEHRVKLFYNHKVNEIVYENEIMTGIITSDHVFHKFDAIICALTPDRIIKILPDNWMKLNFFNSLKEIKFSPIVSSYFWFDTPTPSINFSALLGSNAQWVFNHRDFYSANDYKFPALLSAVTSAADELSLHSIKDIANILYNDLAIHYPELNKIKLLHSRAIVERHATFLATPENESARLENTTPIKGFYLAGDYTATNLPGTLEGAAISGEQAANCLLNDII